MGALKRKTVVLLKKKLIHLDNILPLIFELSRHGLVSKPLFVAPDKPTYDLIRRNLVFYDAIQQIGGRLTFINRKQSRLFNAVQNLIILRDYLLHKIVSVETTWQLGPLISMLALFNQRILGGCRMISFASSSPYFRTKFIADWKQKVRGSPENPENQRKVPGTYDYALLRYEPDKYQEIKGLTFNGRCRPLQVGYTRGLPSWQAYLKQNAERYIPELMGRPYVFFVLNSLGHGIAEEDCEPAGVKLKACLEALKEFEEEILTVFKPHAVTEVSAVKRILEDMDFRNYAFSYAHPGILTFNAKFVFCYTTSTLIPDAYFIGKPTLEYADYDSRMHEVTGGRSLALHCTDYFVYRDREALRSALAELVRQDRLVLRDPNRLKEDFPVLNEREIQERFSFLGDC